MKTMVSPSRSPRSSNSRKIVRLHRHVECRDGFVGDDHAGLDPQVPGRSRCAGAVRRRTGSASRRGHLLGETDEPHQLGAARLQSSLGGTEPMKLPAALSKDLADGHAKG